MGSLGPPLLELTLHRVGYDYFMRLHDMSMLLTVSHLSGHCSPTAPPAGKPSRVEDFNQLPMLLGSRLQPRPLDTESKGRRVRMSSIECADLFRRVDTDGDETVSLVELHRLCMEDEQVRHHPTPTRM